MKRNPLLSTTLLGCLPLLSALEGSKLKILELLCLLWVLLHPQVAIFAKTMLLPFLLLPQVEHVLRLDKVLRNPEGLTDRNDEVGVVTLGDDDVALVLNKGVETHVR